MVHNYYGLGRKKMFYMVVAMCVSVCVCGGGGVVHVFGGGMFGMHNSR